MPELITFVVKHIHSMILTLFIVSGLFLIGGFIFFRKHKALLGWMFVLLGVFGLVLATLVKWLYPHVM